jgi:hypothetical protein
MAIFGTLAISGYTFGFTDEEKRRTIGKRSWNCQRLKIMSEALYLGSN